MLASLPRTLYPDRLLAAEHTKTCILTAATLTQVHVDFGTARGRQIRFKLYPIKTWIVGPRGGRHYEAKYQRLSPSRSWRPKQRRIFALCWHGHRDFMMNLFELLPELHLHTAMAHYRGKQGFEETYESTAERNVGSQMEPVCYADCCTCEDND